MTRGAILVAVGISFLFVFSAMAARPAAAAAASGLYGAYWKDSFFGSSVPAWPGCVDEESPPAGVPSSTPPTATEIDANIGFGTQTGFYWVESSPAVNPPTAAGAPGGFAVGSYNLASSSWGDSLSTLQSLASPSSAYFVNTGFSAEWTGYIYLAANVPYSFQLTSDDGSWLYINTSPGSSTISSANLVINNGGEHGPGSADSSTVTVSTSGNYAIEVDYYETCDSQSGIDLSWNTCTNAVTYCIIPSSYFTPAQIGSNAPSSTSVPQFGVAAPIVATVGLLALVLVKKRVSGRIDMAT